jgi:hypothetical protein
MGVSLPLAPIFLIILVSITITMKTNESIESIESVEDENDLLEYIRIKEQVDLIEKIETSIPNDAWPLVYKAVAEQITEQATVSMLMSMSDYVLENFFKENPEETIPLFLEFFTEKHVIESIENMKLDIATRIPTKA